MTDESNKKRNDLRQNIVSVIVCLLFLAGGAGCGSDDDPVEPPAVEESGAEIYYLNDNLEKQVLEEGDTLSLQVGASLALYIEPAYFPRMYPQSPVRIERESNRFICHARQSALTGVLLTWEEDAAPKQLLFYIDISPSLVYYYITSTTEDDRTVEVQNESMRETILAELKESYTPQFSRMNLFYTTISAGNLELEFQSGEIVKGTFSEDDSEILLFYNGAEHPFRLSYVGELGNEDYVMVQDLTQLFQEKYPLETIDNVTVSTRILRYEG